LYKTYSLTFKTLMPRYCSCNDLVAPPILFGNSKTWCSIVQTYLSTVVKIYKQNIYEFKQRWQARFLNNEPLPLANKFYVGMWCIIDPGYALQKVIKWATFFPFLLFLANSLLTRLSALARKKVKKRKKIQFPLRINLPLGGSTKV